MFSAIFSCINDPQPKGQDHEISTMPIPTDAQLGHKKVNNSNQWQYNSAQKTRELDDFNTPNNRREEYGTADRSYEQSSAAKTYSVFSWADSAGRIKEGSISKKANTFHPADIKWSDKEVKLAREFALRHINLQSNSYEGTQSNWKLKSNANKGMLNSKRMQSWFCGPSCQKDHQHIFEYDFEKNYTDPLSQRPGIDFVLEPKIQQEAAKALNLSQPCEFGNKQTPIDLSSEMEVLKDFKDK